MEIENTAVWYWQGKSKNWSYVVHFLGVTEKPFCGGFHRFFFANVMLFVVLTLAIQYIF
jgi:hypothetical protein